MILKQFYLNCLAQASYLVGDEETRTAAIVDPRRDVDLYLDEARELGLEIKHVFLTHFHADFVAGHLELRDRAGATIYLGARARAEYGFTPMKDGDTLQFGRVRLQVLETPGHTSESISILVFDLARDERRPHAVLTGDTLFAGDVGRPDLRASLGWSATDLGRLLHQSLTSRLLPLPDATLVYPGHGAGSLCGKNISAENVSTIGAERRSNYALQPMSQDEFLTLVTADQPEAPPYFTYDAVLNAQERPTLEAVLDKELTPLPLSEVLDRAAAGEQLLDTRDPADFSQGHLPGSINVGLGGQYATWAGTVLSRERPIVIVAAPGREQEAATRLGRIGFDNVSGYLQGGIDTRGGAAALTQIDRVSATELASQLASGEPPIVLDVRTQREWQRKRIEGSLNISLGQLRARSAEIPRDRPIVVHCAGGYRSSIAISMLQGHGFERLSELAGGMSAWEAARLAVSEPVA